MKTKLALSAFVAALVLSACGSKTEAPAPTTDTTPPPPPLLRILLLPPPLIRLLLPAPPPMRPRLQPPLRQLRSRNFASR
jgi:hypothetical protein